MRAEVRPYPRHGVWIAWLVVVMSACGRIGFDPAGGDDVPIANLVCADDRTAFSNVLPTGELAVTATANGFFAAWTGTANQPAQIVKLDAQFREVTRQTAGNSDPQLVGLLDLGPAVLAAYAEDGIVDMWKFTSDLSIASYWETLAGLAARGPFVTDRSGTQRANLSAFQNLLLSGYLTADGHTNQSANFPMTGTITELAGDNGIHQGVAVWVEDLGGGASRCTAGDIRFDSPTVPNLAAARLVSDDCRHARIAAGPSDDARLIVSTTAGGAVEGRYAAASGDVFRSLSSWGRAPKVRFDGTRFWIAWLENATGELRIATFDLAGEVVTAAQPGPRVAGDDAFQLVRSGSTVFLMALTSEGLESITLCK